MLDKIAKYPAARRSLARRDICPECRGALDTGWECNDCGYDARAEATTIGAASPPAANENPKGVTLAARIHDAAKEHPDAIRWTGPKPPWRR